MTPREPGLVQRMQREATRISSQHRQLEELHALVAEALGRGDLADARQAFARFGDALEAHLSLEDNLYFPALHGLARELEGELAALAAEHEALRSGMRGVSDCLCGASAGACESALAGWVAELADHERREEALLARLRAPRGST